MICKIEKTLESVILKFMMEKMEIYLQPLDHWNDHEKKFVIGKKAAK